MSPTDVSNITFHQVLDCNKCLLMSDRSLRSGKLALVPSVAFDKHMSRGLVLEHRDHHALQEWEGRLRRHLRGGNIFQSACIIRFVCLATSVCLIGYFGTIIRETKSRFLFPILTETEVNNCFSIIT